MWIANRMAEEIELETKTGLFCGQPGVKQGRQSIEAKIPEAGIVGVMFVFKTKTAARKYYGRSIELQEVK